jgi:hypothetical protein
MRVPFSPTSSPTPVGGGVLGDSYYNSSEWDLIVVLSSISFMARDGEHFFMFFFFFGHLDFFF